MPSWFRKPIELIDIVPIFFYGILMIELNVNYNVKHKDALDKKKSIIRVRSIRMCLCLSLSVININMGYINPKFIKKKFIVKVM